MQTQAHDTDFKRKLKELEAERNACLQTIFKMQGKVAKINSEIESLKEVVEVRELTITDHAIKRFKQRVMDLPERRIRQVVISDELRNAYKKHGEGRYGIKNMPHVVAHIRDFSVITIINTSEPERKLEALREYMNHYVDEIALKHQGLQFHIMKFKSFNNAYWRQNRTA